MDILLGLVFAILWASAPVASKIGLHDAAPLTILNIRFVVTGGILITYTYAVRRTVRKPEGREWIQVIILALCNSVFYLGLAWLALKEVSAGVYNLFVASNPFMVAIIALLWLK